MDFVSFLNQMQKVNNNSARVWAKRIQGLLETTTHTAVITAAEYWEDMPEELNKLYVILLREQLVVVSDNQRIVVSPPVFNGLRKVAESTGDKHLTELIEKHIVLSSVKRPVFNLAH